jgi:hypothetical protein
VTRNECAVPGSRKPDVEARLVEVPRTWVGDIHQPLHVSFEDDRGGNSVLVTGLCDAIYIPPGIRALCSKVKIDAASVAVNTPIVREQLQELGVRLAHLLDAALGK